MTNLEDHPIKLTPGNYVSCFFMIDTPDCNIFGCLQMHESGLALTYRFRHFRDSKVWQSKDKRSWYRLSCGTEEDGHRKIQTLIHATEMIYPKEDFKAEVIEVKSDDYDVMLAALEDRPWSDGRKEEDRHKEDHEVPRGKKFPRWSRRVR